jgi:murein DD-endopeptidase MepM/ murein hydrolase activator NlpD
MATPLQIFQQKGMWAWWTQNSGYGTNPFNGVSEKGIDFANTFGTPIGAIQGGYVQSVTPHNNSIGDIVIIQGSQGYWLYQHITSSVTPGQYVGTGDVVGTENGLPRDIYSTGPHIEVRYIPTAAWQDGIDS